MTRRLRQPFLLRLFLALGLIVLGGDLAAPALATALRAGMAMPCHDSASGPADEGIRSGGAHASAGSHQSRAPEPPPDPSAPFRHLCCVLACLVLAPAAERSDPAPALQRVGWDFLPSPQPAGLIPAVPRPPPRLSS